MNYSDDAYEQITGFKANPKPFSKRTDEERQEGFERFLASLENLPDDETVRDFMKDRPMNRVPRPGSSSSPTMAKLTRRDHLFARH